MYIVHIYVYVSLCDASQLILYLSTYKCFTQYVGKYTNLANKQRGKMYDFVNVQW